MSPASRLPTFDPAQLSSLHSYLLSSFASFSLINYSDFYDVRRPAPLPPGCYAHQHVIVGNLQVLYVGPGT
jgi:hypothetical protein